MWFARTGNSADLDKRLVLDALRALRRGDFEISLPPGFVSEDGEIVSTFNDVVQLARTLQDELRDVRVAVGKEGRRTRRLRDAGMRGGWAACAWAVNELLDDVLTAPAVEPPLPRPSAARGKGEKPPCDRFDTVMELLAGAIDAAHSRERDDAASVQARLHARYDDRAAGERALERKASELAARNAELERKLAEAQLAHQRAAEEARRSEAEAGRKAQFLAAMSHELRAPLHTLLGLSKKLASVAPGTLDPTLQQCVEAIGQAGGDLLALADDLLDVAKLESGALGVEPTNVTIAELAVYAERAFQPLAVKRGLSFLVSIDPELPPLLETDAKRVKQVLRNLLENAFKFTERGGVRVSIFRVERRDRVAFAVADTGIGISRADQLAIFEPFRRLAEPVTRESGAGLGLTISKQIAHALGGSLYVSSVPQRGSTFTLELPLPAAERAPAAVEPVVPQRAPAREVAAPSLHPSRPPDPRAAAEPALARRRVRILNGDVRDVFAVTAALEPHGVQVSYGERTGAETDSLDDVSDALLIDIDRPAISGRDALQSFRARYPHIALIAITSREERNARALCIAAGADDCIGKPLDADELVAALKGSLAATVS